jgi:diaminohydroxyphosphoribosylaminopyrimidine deaminase/5-amino-6-(5-phosphoribosylamino)uracil reductase
VLPALRLLYKRFGFTRLLLEGGPTLTGAFLDAGAIDELHLFVAPVLFGGEAPSFAMGEGPAKISRAMRFGPPAVEPIGPDVHLRYLREQP